MSFLKLPPKPLPCPPVLIHFRSCRRETQTLCFKPSGFHGSPCWSRASLPLKCIPPVQPHWPPFFRLPELQPAELSPQPHPSFLRFWLKWLTQRDLPWLVANPYSHNIILSCFHHLQWSGLHICSFIWCVSPDTRLQVSLGQAPSLLWDLCPSPWTSPGYSLWAQQKPALNGGRKTWWPQRDAVLGS